MSFFSCPPEGLRGVLRNTTHTQKSSKLPRALSQPPWLPPPLCISLSLPLPAWLASPPSITHPLLSHLTLNMGKFWGEFQARQDDLGNGLFKASSFGLEYPDPGLKHLCFASSSSTIIAPIITNNIVQETNKRGALHGICLPASTRVCNPGEESNRLASYQTSPRNRCSFSLPVGGCCTHTPSSHLRSVAGDLLYAPTNAVIPVTKRLSVPVCRLSFLQGRVPGMPVPGHHL